MPHLRDGFIVAKVGIRTPREPLSPQTTVQALPSDTLSFMLGPTLQQKLEHLTGALAEAEREYAAGVPYQGPDSWPEKIAQIKQHIADIREMIANE